MKRLCFILACLVIGPGACSSKSTPSAAVEVRMQFDRPGFYAAPFPSDDLRRADGTIDLSLFPNPEAVTLVSDATKLLQRDARGFATTGGVFFSLTGAIDPARLPSMQASVTADAKVFLVRVDDGPDKGTRMPIEVAFETDGGPFGAPNMLSIVPLQGMPLRPSARYAAVVLRSVADPPLAQSASMAALARGARPSTMPQATYDEYAGALAAVGNAADAAALAVFTTDAPLAAMESVVHDILARTPPAPGTFKRTDTFDDYCVYQTTIDMPDYQSGTPPFSSGGGDWQWDTSAGAYKVQRMETANLVVTIPRAPAPAAGFPTTVLIRTGAGGDRPLVDRGVQAVHDGPPLKPGTGPAQQFARAGYAGVQVDGPLGGLRNTTHADEQFLTFNVFNAAALRDNVRESAVELVLLAHVLDTLTVDASDCAGVASSVKLDTSKLALFGHSMGASIAPLVLAFEPKYRAVVLSGAGASWIENVMYKKQPLEVRPAIELFIHYASERRLLTSHDPVLTLIQWAAEPADSQVYASRILREPLAGDSPRHVLMIQGIVDHYIMPPIANAISLSLGLDLAGDELDTQTPEIADLPHLGDVLQYSGRKKIAFPVSANVGGTATAIVVQQREDGIEDGHEVAFQTEPPRYEYKCFLASLLRGTPSVPNGVGMTADGACP